MTNEEGDRLVERARWGDKDAAEALHREVLVRFTCLVAWSLGGPRKREEAASILDAASAIELWRLRYEEIEDPKLLAESLLPKVKRKGEIDWLPAKYPPDQRITFSFWMAAVLYRCRSMIRREQDDDERCPFSLDRLEAEFAGWDTPEGRRLLGRFGPGQGDLQ